MGFGGGKTKTVYVPAPQTADTSAAEAADAKKKKEKRSLEQSYGQALQTAQKFMPHYSESDDTLSSSSLLNLSGRLGG